MNKFSRYIQYSLSILLISCIAIGLATGQQLAAFDVESEVVELLTVEYGEADELDTIIPHKIYFTANVINQDHLLFDTSLSFPQFERYLEARAPPV